MDGGLGDMLRLSFVHFADGQMPLLFLAALATACLKCAALAFVIANPMALSAYWWTLQGSAHDCLRFSLLALLASLTSWVSSLDHQGMENETNYVGGMFWATASLIHCTNFSTPASMSL